MRTKSFGDVSAVVSTLPRFGDKLIVVTLTLSMKWENEMRIRLANLVIATLLTASWLPAQESNVIKMVVRPQPTSSVKVPCKLLPSETEMQNGNAAPVILRMVYEQQAFMVKLSARFPVLPVSPR